MQSFKYFIKKTIYIGIDCALTIQIISTHMIMFTISDNQLNVVRIRLIDSWQYLIILQKLCKLIDI